MAPGLLSKESGDFGTSPFFGSFRTSHHLFGGTGLKPQWRVENLIRGDEVASVGASIMTVRVLVEVRPDWSVTT